MFIKYVIFFTCIFTLSFCKAAVIEDLFTQFIAKHGKKYDTDNEYQSRLAIFQSNLLKAKYLQASDKGTATYGVTKFSDLTVEEFTLQYLIAHKLARAPIVSIVSIVSDPEPDAAVSVDGFDWRTKGAVRPVENQGEMGSSLPFAYQANIDTQYFGRFGKLPTYPASDLCNCSPIMQCRSFSHLQAGDACNIQNGTIKWVGTTSLSKNPAELADKLKSCCPLVAELNAQPLMLYTGGIMHPSKSACDPNQIDHAVALLGFGSEKGAEMESADTPFWIGRNSWGPDWGEAGYFRMFRGGNVCGLEQLCSSADVSF